MKTENLVFDDKNNIKIIDFGYATEFENEEKKLTEYIGTRRYTAPEVFKKIPYNGCKLDIWLLGGILYELVCGIIPLSGPTMYDRAEKGDLG